MTPSVRRVARVLLVGGFLLMLVAPLVEMRARWFARPLDEKRELARLPSLAPVDRFPAAFEAYFRDHFGFRDQAVRWYTRLQVYVFHRSPVDQVIIGDEGWLFYAGPHGDATDIDDLSGRHPFSEEELASVRDAQVKTRDELAKHGAKYLLVMAPNKQTIYPEHLPGAFAPRGPTRADQLFAYLRAHSDLALIDLRGPIEAVRRDRELYYRTDLHWNQDGAFVAYREIARALSKEFPAVTVPSQDEFSITRKPRAGGGLAKMLAMVDEWPDTEVKYTPIGEAAQKTSKGMFWTSTFAAGQERGFPRIMMVHDSFGLWLAPLLAQRASYLYCSERLFDLRDPRTVEREKPDVVVRELLERNLPP